MVYLAAHHWETGEEHAAWVNLEAAAPPVDIVSGTGALSGGFSKRLEFDTNDNFGAEEYDAFARATAGTAILMGLALQIDSLADFDEFHFWFQTAGSTADGFIGLSIGSNGAVTVRGNNADGPSFDSSPTDFFTSAAGLIVAGVRNYVSMRVVVDGSVGEFAVEVNGVEIYNQTGLDTFEGTGTNETGWGWGVYISSIGTGVNNSVVLLDDHVLADAFAVPFPPQFHEALTPNGSTADNDGTPTGAATNHEATDEIPADGGTTFMTMPVGKQGFDFGARTHTGTPNTVQMWSAIGDPAAGSEVVNAFASDGTEVDGPVIGLTTSFDPQAVTDLLNTPPSGGSWNTASIDALTGGIERVS